MAMLRVKYRARDDLRRWRQWLEKCPRQAICTKSCMTTATMVGKMPQASNLHKIMHDNSGVRLRGGGMFIQGVEECPRIPFCILRIASREYVLTQAPHWFKMNCILDELHVLGMNHACGWQPAARTWTMTQFAFKPARRVHQHLFTEGGTQQPRGGSTQPPPKGRHISAPHVHKFTRVGRMMHRELHK